jgi:hypothetical protein
MSVRRLAPLAILVLIVTLAPAQPPKSGGAAKGAAAEPNLATAHGAVDKVDRSSLTIKPRSATGKFEKEFTLQLTGTSRVTQLVYQTQGGKTTVRQTDVDAKDLKPQQTIAVIYTKLDSGAVLLSATVLKAGE